MLMYTLLQIILQADFVGYESFVRVGGKMMKGSCEGNMYIHINVI